MDSRKRLAMTLHLASEETDRMKWYAAIKWVEESGYAPEWRTLQHTAYRQADAILSSDWLREQQRNLRTLASIRGATATW